MNERDNKMIIAILVRRLGGKVEISNREFANLRGDDNMLIFHTMNPPAMHIEVEMPRPDALDAEFEVVGEVKRLGR